MIPATILLAAAAGASPFEQVVAAERAFAADSPVKGLHGAFLQHLAEDAVVFNPTPAPGRPAHDGKPRAAGTLRWSPAWVVVAASGDFGVSSGPADYRVPGDAEPAYTGWFLSVWRKDAEGTWKVRADIGTACPLEFAEPATVENGLAAREAAAPSRDRASLARARMRLSAEESRLAGDAREGLGTALASRIDDATRVHRDGTCPAAGAEGRDLAANDARKLACEPERVELASSGDLGFAYGSCSRVGEDPDVKTGYLRVWRREADRRFKVLVDVVLDVPKK